MPVLKQLFESRSVENPLKPLTDASLVEVLGGTPTYSGTTVNEKNSLNLSAVYRAVGLISGSIAGLPLNVFQEGSYKPIEHPLLNNPNAGSTDFEYWETVAMHLLLWGNSYSEKVYVRASSTVSSLIPIDPGRVKTKRVTKTEGNPQGKAFVIDGSQELTPNEILHIPGLGYDGVCGLSPIQLARQGLGVGLAAEEAAARLFGSGSLLSGVLQTDAPLTQDQADLLKKRWQDKVGGLSKSHEIAVLGNGAKFQPVSMPPEDAQFLQSREFQIVDIARWFGLPPHLLGSMEKSTTWGTGIEQQTIGYVVYTLKPWLKRIERRVTKELLKGPQYAKFLVEGLLRGDTGSRYEAYSKGLQGGYLSINDIRRKEDEEPIVGGDEYLRPLNMTPVGTEISLKDKVDALGALIRAGFEPNAAAAYLGIEDIDHTGLRPVTVQAEPQPEPEPEEPDESDT